jgi:hypothetical protein
MSSSLAAVALTDMRHQRLEATTRIALLLCAGACSDRLNPLSSTDGGTHDGHGSGGAAPATGSGGSGGAGTGGAGGGAGGAGGSAGVGLGSGGSGGDAGTGPGGTAGAGGTIIADSGRPPLDACPEMQQAKALPVDLLIVADRSRTMNCPLEVPGQACDDDGGHPPTEKSRWTAQREAIIQFASTSMSSGGPGIMLGVTPLLSNGDANVLICEGAEYAFPLLREPSDAIQISAALRAQTVGGGAVFGPVLGGSSKVLRWHGNTAGKNHQVTIVMMADTPAMGSCNNDSVAHAADMAALEFGLSPPIRTSVIAIGPGLDDLDAVAAAGGTLRAHSIDTSGATVIEDIKAGLTRAAYPCDYGLPTNLPDINPARTHLQWRIPSRNAVYELSRVNQAADCSEDRPAWFYDSSTAPTRVSLCPSTCERMRAAPDSEVDYLPGCGPTP